MRSKPSVICLWMLKISYCSAVYCLSLNVYSLFCFSKCRLLTATSFSKIFWRSWGNMLSMLKKIINFLYENAIQISIWLCNLRGLYLLASFDIWSFTLLRKVIKFEAILILFIYTQDNTHNHNKVHYHYLWYSVINFPNFWFKHI